jgi:hypothetical protein
MYSVKKNRNYRCTDPLTWESRSKEWNYRWQNKEDSIGEKP